jgi:hypothetical protein
MWLKDVRGMYSGKLNLWIALFLVVLGFFFYSPLANAYTTFPVTPETSEAGDILNLYTPYLNYVVDIGRETNAPLTQRLVDTYQTLRRTNPVGAARFLKGLRFEMVERLELVGMAPEKASTRNPEMRRWVAHFLKDWVREADEHLFRAIAMRSTHRK